MKDIKCVGFDMESVADIPLMITTWFFRPRADKKRPYVYGGVHQSPTRKYRIHETPTQIVLRKQ